MKHRKFTSTDQIAFAELSGDFNPLHVDTVVARRLLFGSTVVHGIHSLLWSLDSWLEDRTENIEFRSIKVIFSKPIRVDEEVSLFLKPVNKNHFRIELLSAESIGTVIEIEWGKSEHRESKCFEAKFPPKHQPHLLSEDEIRSGSGSLDIYLNIEVATRYFPHLLRCVSPHQIAVLMGTTRLVGIVCPGLHSLYSELNLFADKLDECTKLKYEVTKFDKRFGLVNMKIMAPGMSGFIKAFVRPKPQKQDSYLSFKELVNGNEFSGQRALVIGGSRGLGEVTSKLLSMGGGRGEYHLLSGS